jgi:hypothetical protein
MEIRNANSHTGVEVINKDSLLNNKNNTNSSEK